MKTKKIVFVAIFISCISSAYATDVNIFIKFSQEEKRIKLQGLDSEESLKFYKILEKDSKSIVSANSIVQDKNIIENLAYEIVFSKNESYLFFSNGIVFDKQKNKFFKSKLLFEIYKKYGALRPLNIAVDKDYHIIELHHFNEKNMTNDYKLPVEFYFIPKPIDLYVLNKNGDNIFILKNMLKPNDYSVKLDFLVLKYFIGSSGLNSTCIINQKGQFKWYENVHDEEKFIREIHTKKMNNKSVEE